MFIRPRKKVTNIDIKLARDGAMDERIKKAELEILPYDERWGTYRLILSEEDMQKNIALIRDLLRLSYQNRAE